MFVRSFANKQIILFCMLDGNRYVRIIEGDTADVLTLHQRGEDGKYDKRTSSVRAANRKELFFPPHLYGQLSRHPMGFRMLIDNGSLDTYIGVSVCRNH